MTKRVKQCEDCGGSGLVLDINGEPTHCRTCGGSGAEPSISTPASAATGGGVAVSEVWRDMSTAPMDGTEVLVRIKPKLIRLGWYFAPSSKTKGWMDESGHWIKPYQWAPLPADHAPPPPAQAADGWMPSRAAEDVLAERRRQVEIEGWTPEHDDQHDAGEIATAAALYAMENGHLGIPLSACISGVPKAWPWSRDWWKPKGQRRDLVRAAALLIADIERLDRAAPPSPEAGS